MATHERFIRSTVAAFRDHLGPLIEQAKARTIARLGRQLTYEPDGRIRMTAANQRLLRGVARMYLEELDKGGYDRILNAFTRSFPGQIPDFRAALEAVGAPAIAFGPKAQAALASHQVTAKAVIRGAVEQAAMAAQNEALLTVGGLPYEDLAQAIGKRLDAAPSRAETLANTAMTTYYRMLSAAAHPKLGGTPRYKFANIIDKVTRPWCKGMVELSKTRSWTRAEIEAMDNHQLPNPFLTGGGFACRGAWVLDSL